MYVCMYVCMCVKTSGRLPVFMLIGWRAANMSSMSSCEERNIDERGVLCLPNLALWTVCSNAHIAAVDPH